jgi:hypothetical protein
MIWNGEQKAKILERDLRICLLNISFKCYNRIQWDWLGQAPLPKEIQIQRRDNWQISYVPGSVYPYTGIYWAYRKVCAELFVRALVIPCVNLCLYGFPLADASWPTAAESTPSKQLPRRGHPGKSAVLQQPITLALKWKRPYKIL